MDCPGIIAPYLYICIYMNHFISPQLYITDFWARLATAQQPFFQLPGVVFKGQICMSHGILPELLLDLWCLQRLKTASWQSTPSWRFAVRNLVFGGFYEWEKQHVFFLILMALWPRFLVGTIKSVTWIFPSNFPPDLSTSSNFIP